jgi:hypothetical protein
LRVEGTAMPCMPGQVNDPHPRRDVTERRITGDANLQAALLHPLARSPSLPIHIRSQQAATVLVPSPTKAEQLIIGTGSLAASATPPETNMDKAP